MCSTSMASPFNYCGLAALMMLAGCAPVSPAPEQPQAVRTIPIPQLAREIDRHRGEIVRTCGEQLEPTVNAQGDILRWELSTRDSITRFPASVVVAACNGGQPPIENGCVTGRVAREDGSLEEPERWIVTDHEIVNYEWWLHPQCPSS